MYTVFDKPYASYRDIVSGYILRIYFSCNMYCCQTSKCKIVWKTQNGYCSDPKLRVIKNMDLQHISMIYRLMTRDRCDITTWASYQIRKIKGCACAGNARNDFPATLQRKPIVNDTGILYGTCVTHVPLCVSGSLNPQRR